MNQDRKDYLLRQFERDQLEEDDAKELLEEMCSQDDKELIEDISSLLIGQEKELTVNAEVWRKMLHHIVSVDKPLISKYPFRRWLTVAASIVVISFTCFYFFTQEPAVLPQPKVENVKISASALDHAVLTLANGEKITLDRHATENLIKHGNNVIINPHKGQLEITGSKSILNQQTNSMLMLETPRGGKYMMTLPDGSKVWLNAASRIRFPETFSKTAREVYIQGEAYFEVVNASPGNKKNKWPFLVKTGKHVVEVLGTHFNVNAYSDENEIKTTLLEGAVNVYHGDMSLDGKNRHPAVLKPLQQSTVKTDPQNSNILLPPVITLADLDQTMAWKNNLFRFKDTEIKTIMRELARWYNVEVEYESEIPKDKLTGYVSRDVPVEKVLKMLEATSTMSFTIKNNVISVKNNLKPTH
jgi:transmembrane sensor